MLIQCIILLKNVFNFFVHLMKYFKFLVHKNIAFNLMKHGDICLRRNYIFFFSFDNVSCICLFYPMRQNW